MWGHKFHRQKAIFVYRENNNRDRFIIADFYCHKYKLIIEVDGSVHDHKIVKDYDNLKEGLMSNLGYTIVRFSNDEVYNNISEVVKKIENKIGNESPLF